MTGPLEIARLPGETLGGLWARRAISIPLVAALAALAWGGAPAWLAAALLHDLVRRAARRRPATRAVLFFLLYLAAEALGVAAAALVWLAAAGGRRGGTARYLARNAALQRTWSSALFHGARRIYGMRIEVEAGGGDGPSAAPAGARGAPPADAPARAPGEAREAEIPASSSLRPLVVLVRHTSTADTVLTAALVANPLGLRLRYVLKRELLWDPCLDIVGRRLPNAFVDRSGQAREREIEAVAALGRGLGPGEGVLIYPEGTRFSAEKRARAIDDLRARGRADLAEAAERLRHTLLPRPGGVVALLEAAPTADVLLVEHAGFEAASSFRRLWRGDLVGATIRVRLRRFPATAIPAGDRYGWLLDRWAELDDWLERGGGAA